MSFLSPSTAVPLSPTSPPESGLKRRHQTETPSESPKSPSLMSVATKSYVSAYGTSQHQHTDEGSSRSAPRSPRKGPSASLPQQSIHPQSLPTPAHSVTGMSSFGMAEDLDQHRDKRPRLDGAGFGEADQSEVQTPTQATNHDRHNVTDTDITMTENADEPQNSLDRAADNTSRHAEGEVTLEQLQKDMGEAFLLCRSKVERQRPNPQKHLLALYGMNSLLHSVARIDPKTGEKINKLRKSYEGQIKSFGLAGRNKPVKAERNVEEDQPGPLRRMAGSSPWGLEPDAQWNAEHAKSKIEVTPDFRAKLKQAMQMQPGTVRDNTHWEDVLGFDKPKPTGFLPPRPATPVAPQPAFSRYANGVTARQSVPATAEPKRQTRGKKRSYGDDSFVGYGEGYSDPEDGDGDDGDDYGSQRKRKKVMLMA
ncbi:hypothetical protein ABEF92_006903 [Exophiala dermatitidis]|uniref:Mediator of RNA polymerase II transcription subunit 19 n=1 Tax=Exophiala dermatitidis (strain ATCC 34100 / CBS 525.76 / NIH/UT8656) TaxID=858893 RepID=H6C086_EXODN|nr:uncharacterized protein HMPREF1120_04450 [Exophiala dermatitidis NIH/UT8656]EHY56368.1 hypothetical protein HMPREF1120_04450 [Exophiala dermatitidis NIH/UT8656]